MHEHLDEVGIINMNGRIYDPVLGRFLQPDNYVQSQFDLQTFNRYTYALNNPLKYTDPDGNNPLAVAAVLGAVMGGIQGYMIGKANGATGWELFGYTMAGAGIGAIAGLAGGAIAASGAPFAGTSSLIFSSAISSSGLSMLNSGKSDVMISFGAASYNANQNEWGYLGKEGNSNLENLGYTMGAMANLQDLVAGLNGTDVDVVSRRKLGGHSEIKGKYKNPNDILISVGPDGSSTDKFLNQQVSDVKWETQYITKSVKAENVDYIGSSKNVFTTKIRNINGKILSNMTSNINGGKNLLGFGEFNYGLARGCVNYTSRALLFAGVPTINAFLPITAPVFLNFELGIRQLAIYSSPYMINYGK